MAEEQKTQKKSEAATFAYKLIADIEQRPDAQQIFDILFGHCKTLVDAKRVNELREEINADAVDFLKQWIDRVPLPPASIMPAEAWDSIRNWFIHQTHMAEDFSFVRTKVADHDNAMFFYEVSFDGMDHEIDFRLVRGNLFIDCPRLNGKVKEENIVRTYLGNPKIEDVAQKFALVEFENGKSNTPELSGDSDSDENQAFVEIVKKYVLLHGYRDAVYHHIKSEHYVEEGERDK